MNVSQYRTQYKQPSSVQALEKYLVHIHQWPEFIALCVKNGLGWQALGATDPKRPYRTIPTQDEAFKLGDYNLVILTTTGTQQLNLLKLWCSGAPKENILGDIMENWRDSCEATDLPLGLIQLRQPDVKLQTLDF